MSAGTEPVLVVAPSLAVVGVDINTLNSKR